MNRKQSANMWVYGCTLSFSLGFTSIAFGQTDQPSLDDLLDLSPDQPTQDQTTPETPETLPGNENLTESVNEALTASDAADAFEQAVEEMDHVSRRLGRSFDPGVETQRMQESIMRKLDQVIEAAKQQSSSGGGGSSQPREQDQGSQSLAQQGQPSGGEPQPAGQQASSGQAGVTTPIKPEMQDSALEQLRKEWGVLPPRVREELSDGLRERFSPLYRRMTEAYYKALAEQE
jgi:hypothetical protein